MLHESLTAATDMAVLLSEQEAVSPRASALATYHLGTPRDQYPAVSRWHAHLRGLVKPIHETYGLG